MIEQDRSQWLKEKTAKIGSKTLQKAALVTSSLIMLANSFGNVEGLDKEPSNSPEPIPGSLPRTTMPGLSEREFGVDTLNETPNAPTVRSLMRGLPLPPDISQMISSGNSKIAIDKDGIPLGYVLAEGSVGVFDQKEMRQLKEKAIKTNEPQIIAMFPLIMDVNVNDFEFKDDFKSGHQEVFSLPEDVLSPEELERRGVRIIQADNTNLYIREGAFAKGAPLEDFNNTGRELNIVLINGPFVSRLFMEDPRYDGFRNYIEEKQTDIAGFKSKKIKELRTTLLSLRAKLEEINDSSGTEEEKTSDMLKYRKEILRSKVILFAFERVWTPDQIRELIENESFKDDKVVTAEYDSGPKTILTEEVLEADGTSSTITKTVYNQPMILIAVGKSTSLRREVLFFNEDGILATVQTIGMGTLNINLSPKPNQSYPNPADFVLYPNASSDKPLSLPFGGGQAAGFNLHHELRHDELIAQKLNKGESPNWSEYDTDMKAMREIQDAWDIWEGSGFKDNNGYPFVFSLPDGSYILTKNWIPNSAKPLPSGARA